MTQEADQSEFKVMIKKWLKSHKLDYRWVAEQCGVSEITVRNWMSQKNIPPLKLQLLEKVMVQMPTLTAPAGASAVEVPGVSVNATLSLTVQLAPELYTRLVERAAAQGMTMETLVAQAIASLVAESRDSAATAELRSRKVILPTNR